MWNWLRNLLTRLGLLREAEIHYIGGSDTLPPPLSRKREAELLNRLDQESARQELIEHNLRLVVYIARRFENTGINIEDLISIGTIGLIKAVQSIIILSFFNERNVFCDKVPANSGLLPHSVPPPPDSHISIEAPAYK